MLKGYAILASERVGKLFIASFFNDCYAVYGSKTEAVAEAKRLRRLAKAGNGLRKIEGSKERNFTAYIVVPFKMESFDDIDKELHQFTQSDILDI